MNHLFSGEQDDNFLRFLDSPHTNSRMFQSQQTPAKTEENGMIEESIQPEFKTKPAKRKRGQNKGKSRSRKKVFYNQRMASLKNIEDGEEKEIYNYRQSPRNKKSPITREEQLKRNRVSAKNCRMRKKEYFQTLQDKIHENQLLIQELQQRLEEAQKERDRLREENRSYIKQFITSKSQAYDKMNEVLQLKGKKCTERINEELNILKSKFGAAGSDRIATTDFYMKEILGIFTGDIHKYLMNCALENSGLFGTGQWTPLDDQICSILNVSKDTRGYLSQTYKHKMFKEFELFKDLARRFYDGYLTVQRQAKVIQKIFDDVILEFSSENIASLLLWIEQNKFQKDIKKLRAQWISSIVNPVEQVPKPRKLTRHQLEEA